MSKENEILELVVLSGKGGTGKTTITAAFANLAQNALLIDCDVDAADLHLITAPQIVERHPFISGKEASVIRENCSGCGVCAQECRFDAFELNEDGTYKILPIRCEGCGLCLHLCPSKAIAFEPRHCGEWFVSETRFGPMVHAHLFAAEENSGLLVTQVRKAGRELAVEQKKSLIISDGSPGIGCPVISSVTGASAVMVVTEPTISAFHDLKRVTALARQFEIPVYVCVNRSDIQEELTAEIERFVTESGDYFVGTIPFDTQIVAAQLEGKTIVEYAKGESRKKIEQIWERVCRAMQKRV